MKAPSGPSKATPGRLAAEAASKEGSTVGRGKESEARTPWGELPIQISERMRLKATKSAINETSTSLLLKKLSFLSATFLSLPLRALSKRLPLHAISN